MKDKIIRIWEEYGWLLVITTAIVLLQTAVGVMLWDRLPDTLVTHFDVSGEPNGYSSKEFTVFGMPLLLLAVQGICLLASCSGNSKIASADPRVRRLVIFIIPAVSLFVMVMTYGYALDMKMNVGRMVCFFMGALFAVLGNYLPKLRHNYTTGIKLPWTLADDENWNKTHRMAAPVWVVCGIALIVCGLIGYTSWFAFAIIMIMVFLPTVYSLALHIRKKRG